MVFTLFFGRKLDVKGYVKKLFKDILKIDFLG